MAVGVIRKVVDNLLATLGLIEVHSSDIRIKFPEVRDPSRDRNFSVHNYQKLGIDNLEGTPPEIKSAVLNCSANTGILKAEPVEVPIFKRAFENVSASTHIVELEFSVAESKNMVIKASSGDDHGFQLCRFRFDAPKGMDKKSLWSAVLKPADISELSKDLRLWLWKQISLKLGVQPGNIAVEALFMNVPLTSKDRYHYHGRSGNLIVDLREAGKKGNCFAAVANISGTSLKLVILERGDT